MVVRAGMKDTQFRCRRYASAYHVTQTVVVRRSV